MSNEVLYDMVNEDELFLSSLNEQQKEKQKSSSTEEVSVLSLPHRSGNDEAFESVCMVDSIIIENFKSYGGVQKVGPFTRLNAVIGPNGAGKSNLMDALSFVLGIQSRHLRGTRLIDLIYRKENEILSNESSRKCSVTLILIDKKNMKRIFFTRKISSKGIAHFFIDNKQVNQEAYINKLSDYNILVKARNFLVFQGSVEEIAQKDAHELANLLECICVTESLKQQSEACEKEFSEMKFLNRSLCIKKKQAEFEKIEILKQKEEADLYESKLVELSSLLKEVFLFRLYHNEQISKKMLEQKICAKEEIKKLELKISDKTNEIQKKESERAKIILRLNQTEKNIQLNNQKIDIFKRDMVTENAHIEFAENKINDLRKKKENQETLILEFSNRKKQLQKELEDTHEDMNRLDEEIRKIEKENIKLTKPQIKQFDELNKKCLLVSASNNLNISLIENQIKDGKNNNIILSEEIAEIVEQIASLEGSFKEFNCKLIDASEKLEKYKDEVEEKRRVLGNLEEENNNSTLIRENLMKRKEELDEANFLLNSNQTEMKKEQKRQNIIKDIQQNCSVTYGYLSSLVTPISRRFNLSVSSAIGKYANHIVTDNLNTAKRAIDYLRTMREDRMQFIPLDRIEQNYSNEKLREILPRGIKLAIDCVQFDSKFENIFKYVLRDCVIVESLEEGTRIAKDIFSKRKIKLKVITFNGETVMRNSNIIIDTSKNLRNRFDFNDYRKINNELDEITSKLKEIDDNEGCMSNRLENLQKEIDRLNRACLQINSKKEFWFEQVNSKEKEIDKLKHFLVEKKNQKLKIEKTIKEKENEKRLLEEKIKAQERDIFKSFTEDLGVDIKKIESLLSDAKQKRLEYNALFHNRKAKLLGDLEETESKLIKLKDVEKYENEHEKLQSQIEISKTKMNNLNQDIQILQKQIEKEKEEQFEMKQTKKVIDTDLAKMKEELETLGDESERYANTVSFYKSQMKTKDNEIRRMISEALLQNIEIPLLSGNYNDLKDLAEDRALQNDLCICYDSLSFDQKKAKDLDLIKEIESEMLKRIEDIRSFVDKNSPNMKAKEKFYDIQTQIRCVDEQLSTVRKQYIEAERKFKDIRKTRAEAFLKCFKFVQTAIDEIYYNLTKENEGALGGQAFLELDDESQFNKDDEPYKCGIRFHAMPPSKRFRDIQELSGGEKTMAALALLFALQSYYPSPFFVLDEVDAALDPKNVQALAYYLQKTRFQSIVISLKDKLYSRVETLVGVFKDVEGETSSTLSIDLTKYQNVEDDRDNCAERYSDIQCNDFSSANLSKLDSLSCSQSMKSRNLVEDEGEFREDEETDFQNSEKQKDKNVRNPDHTVETKNPEDRQSTLHACNENALDKNLIVHCSKLSSAHSSSLNNDFSSKVSSQISRLSLTSSDQTSHLYNFCSASSFNFEDEKENLCRNN